MDFKHRWAISNTIFITVASMLVILHFTFSYFSIKKLLAVRKEPKHSVKKLKIIFWSLVVSLNIIATICRLFGWSEKNNASMDIRFIFELLDVGYKFIFTSILLTTIFIIKNVIIMAKGNGTSNVEWSRYYSAILTFVPLSLIELSWPAIIFYSTFSKGPLVFYPDNTEAARTLTNQVLAKIPGNVIANVNGAYAQYEFIIRLFLSIYLGSLLWEVNTLMKAHDNFTSIRKYKLKEWSFFTLGCIMISIAIVYEGIANLKTNNKWENKWWNFFFFDFLGQLGPESIKENSKVIGLHDIFGIIIGVYIGGVLTFLAPCRNVKKKK